MFWKKERKIFGYCLLKLQNQEKTQKRNSWVGVSPQVAVSTGPAGAGFQCSSVENCDCRGKQPWRPWALLGLSLYLFLVTFYFWGYLTTGFENNIDRGWLHTNTKQIPQLTGSRYTLSADGFTSCKTCGCVNHSFSQGCLLFPEHLTQGGSGRLYLRRAKHH